MPIGALYIHFPFCVKKCIYCDFTSFARQPFYEYIDALKKEFLLKQPLFDDLKFNSIFFGGGTPSLIPVDWLDDILSFLKSTSLISNNAEITIEANPESLDAEKIIAYQKMGINRLSIGVQSFDDEVLKKTGRIHDQQSGIDAIINAFQLGLENINIDLIAGLPGETRKTWEINKEIVSQMPLKHISTYMLEVARGTKLYRKISNNSIQVTDEPPLQEYFSDWIAFLNQCGWNHYEISNFAKKNYKCLHNLHYWKGSEYLGLGLNAVSRLKNIRHRNNARMNNYLIKLSQKLLPIAWSEKLSPSTIINEHIMLGLRLLNDGIDLHLLDQKKNKIIFQWISKGKLIIKNKRLLLSKEGVFCSNEIIASLMV